MHWFMISITLQCWATEKAIEKGLLDNTVRWIFKFTFFITGDYGRSVFPAYQGVIAPVKEDLSRKEPM